MRPPSAEERAAAVAEAWTWVGTPYHHAAAVKGAGVDCAMILREVYAAVGLIERFEPEYYPPDWHLHRDGDRYVETVLRFAGEFDPAVEPIEPADVLVWKIGRSFAHGAIWVGPDQIIHAYASARQVEAAKLSGSPLEARPMRAFSLWEKPGGGR